MLTNFTKLAVFKVALLFTLANVLNLGDTCAQNTKNKRKFRVYNALLFKETPDLTRYGFSRFNIIYEDGVISTNYHVKDEKSEKRRFVDYEKIQKRASVSKKQRMPVCLDVEHWDLYNKETKEYATKQYVDLLAAYRKIDRKNLVSVFHYGSISQEIYDSSNIIYPAFYTHSEDMGEWEAMVRNSVRSNRARGSKPIYAFIWPQYNPVPKRHKLGYSFVEREKWKRQLELLYELCDGIVIWSHYRDEKGNDILFDLNMPWFQETVEFITRKKIRVSK